MITIIFVILTTAVSLLAFSKRELIYKLSLNPYSVVKRNEWYRLFSCSLIHGDMTHLFVNMFVLWSFGGAVEGSFGMYEAQGLINNSTVAFFWLYFGGVIFSSLGDLSKKNQNNPMYNSIGASGGVTAVLFASIFLSPWSKLYFFFVIPIPKILFGVGYLIYTYQMDKKSGGKINHRAHLMGAIFGVLYLITLNIDFLTNFIHKLLNP